MPYEEGLAHFELAKHATSKIEASRHLQSALKCFTEVGAAFDANRCDEFLSIQRTNTVTSSGRSFTSIRGLLGFARQTSPGVAR